MSDSQKSKIKLTIENEYLNAMRSIVAEFDDCANVGSIILSATSSKKNIKLTEQLFCCVGQGICRSLNSGVYGGGLYDNLVKLKSLFDDEYESQKGEPVRR